MQSMDGNNQQQWKQDIRLKFGEKWMQTWRSQAESAHEQSYVDIALLPKQFHKEICMNESTMIRYHFRLQYAVIPSFAKAPTYQATWN